MVFSPAIPCPHSVASWLPHLHAIFWILLPQPVPPNCLCLIPDFTFAWSSKVSEVAVFQLSPCDSMLTWWRGRRSDCNKIAQCISITLSFSMPFQPKTWHVSVLASLPSVSLASKISVLLQLERRPMEARVFPLCLYSHHFPISQYCVYSYFSMLNYKFCWEGMGRSQSLNVSHSHMQLLNIWYSTYSKQVCLR